MRCRKSFAALALAAVLTVTGCGTANGTAGGVKTNTESESVPGTDSRGGENTGTAGRDGGAAAENLFRRKHYGPGKGQRAVGVVNGFSAGAPGHPCGEWFFRLYGMGKEMDRPAE